MNYTSTITAITVHTEGDNPVFGESCTTVQLEDEGGGCFVVLKQNREDGSQGEVRMDFDEASVVFDVIRQLADQHSVKITK